MAKIVSQKMKTGAGNFLFFFIIFLFFFLGTTAKAATLSVGPSTGTFTVGSSFNISVFLNTEGQSINALEISLIFPQDKLQVVSPSAGQSIISVWTAQPRFNNQTGRIDLQGGIPGGINVSNGLITQITFRVKSVGTATLKFLDNSKTLLNDGKGTDVLEQKINGVYQLILPPPAGPIVASETHPDQSIWYSNPHVVLQWASDQEVDNYSYVLNEEPVDLPDDIGEGLRNSVVYKNVSDGIHYFHIKASKGGAWGGITHIAVKIDTSPPAEFPINISPSPRTIRKQPVIEFITTDALSGIDRYELKIISLKLQKGENPDKDSTNQPFFIEATSPYVSHQLELGTYDVIVRAYDKAGNWRESVQRLAIVSQIFQVIPGQGLQIMNMFSIPWLWFWFGCGFLFMLLGFIIWGLYRWNKQVEFKRVQKQLPDNIKKRLEELREYQEKYGKKMLLLFFMLMLGTMVFPIQGILGQEVELTPPLITSISRNISNEEIFYIGGKTDSPQTQVIIYLQNLQSGETISQIVTSDERGDWFYRHHTFLASGNYRLWVQSKIANQISPPSPQTEMKVGRTAIQFGASRISYETLYGGISIVLFLMFLALIGYILSLGYRGRKKHLQFLKEMREVEESIRRGFAILRRDIEAELAYERKIRPKKSFTPEEKAKEEQILKDLEAIEQHIGKEVLDVWEIEHTD